MTHSPETGTINRLPCFWCRFLIHVSNGSYMLGQGGTGPSDLAQAPKFLIGSIVISLSRCCLPNDDGPGPQLFFLEPPLHLSCKSGTRFVWYQIPPPIRTLFYSKPESGVHVTEVIIYRLFFFQPTFWYNTRYNKIGCIGEFIVYVTVAFSGGSGENIWGAWPLIIWEATTAKQNYYRTN